MKIRGWLIIVVILLVATQSVFAFDGSSTNFNIRQKINTIGGSGDSTSFGVRNTGGQTSTGRTDSTSFITNSGILKFLFDPISPIYSQAHYHWRNDDGSETTATSATSGIEDVSLNPIIKGTSYRLRLSVSNEGGTREDYSPQQFRLEYGVLATTCSAIVSWVDVGAVGGDWDIVNSSNITDGNNTTNIAEEVGGVTDENRTFIVANAGVKDTSSTVAAVSVPSDSFIELEYSIEALPAAVGGSTYCFRVTNAGNTNNFVYDTYAQGTVGAAAPTISFSISDNTIGFGTLSSSAVRYATGDTSGTGSETVAHTLSAETNATSGYVIYVRGATLTSGGNTIDAIGGSATASSIGTEQFGLKVSASGGSGAAVAPYATANYAYAANAVTQDIIAQSGSASASTTFGLTYIANISNTTQSGSYTTNLIYTAVGTF